MTGQRNTMDISAELMQLHARLERLEQEAVVRHSVQQSVQPLEMQVYRLLIRLGVPSRLCGFQYLKSAVLTAFHDASVMHKVTGRLYPDIARRYQTTGTRVERGMRHAIEVAWGRGDLDLQEEIFGSSISPDKGKPTNSEFVCAVIEYLRHTSGCR